MSEPEVLHLEALTADSVTFQTRGKRRVLALVMTRIEWADLGQPVRLTIDVTPQFLSR